MTFDLTAGNNWQLYWFKAKADLERFDRRKKAELADSTKVTNTR